MSRREMLQATKHGSAAALPVVGIVLFSLTWADAMLGVSLTSERSGRGSASSVFGVRPGALLLCSLAPIWLPDSRRFQQLNDDTGKCVFSRID